MNRILLFVAALCLALPFKSFSQCGCNFVITPSSPYVWDGVKMGVKPGDKICFANGTRPDIMLMNIHGTAAQPVTISNMCDGKVVVQGTGGTGRLLYMGNNSFVRVTGSANPAIQYGIEVTAGVQGIDFRDLSTDVELDHVYFYNIGYSAINAKTDPTCDPATWRGNFVMRNVLVHDNKINNTQTGEGIYIGESHYHTTVTVTPCNLQAQEHEIIGCQVYNNILTNIGRDGIQVGSATTNCSIHDNSIYNVGMTHEGYDASGIQINPGTNAETYNNVVDTGFGFGVFAGGEGASHLYNNIIANFQMGGIESAAYSPVNTSGFIFSNNTLINNANLGIQSYANNTPNTFVNNIIVAPTTGAYKYVDANAPGIKWTESNNIKTSDINSLKFVNAAGKDYHLQTSSPAKDAGISMAAKGVTFDLDHLPRPSGASFDIGAYEFQGGAANKAPVANAGADIIVTLPTTTATITGTGTDSDGSISAYSWTKISGGTVTLTNATTAKVSLSALAQGSYVFRLTVTDNAGATATDDVAVTVNASANKAPVANAGADKAITLPLAIATLTGTGTDSDGTITGYAWTKVSGPTATLTNPLTGTLSLAALLQGTYVFRLTVTDNAGATGYDDVTVTVNPIVTTNKAPIPNAGADKTITLPVNSTTVTGTATDPDGTISAWSWTKVSGPSATLANATTATLSLSALVQGSYVFRLTVTDNAGATAYDDVTITVKPANVAPVANAGADRVLTLPANAAVITGSATDADGTIVSWAWTKTSGPAATLANTTTSSLSLSALVQGSYVFRLTVTDNAGATGYDDIIVTVNAASALPTGVVSRFNFTDQTQNVSGWIDAVGSPHAAVATAKDPATGFAISSVATAQWPPLQNATPNSSFHGGVTNGTIEPPAVVWTQWLNYGAPYGSTVNGVVQGDNVMLSGLNPSKTYNLQMGASRASGSGSDRYGNVEYRVKGVNPQLLLITNNATNEIVYTGISPDASGKIGISARKHNGDSPMQIGYIGWLIVTETGSSSSARIESQPPVADAGSDQSILNDALTIGGTGTSLNGAIASYEWTQQTGGKSVLSNQFSQTMTAGSLAPGAYVFRLTVTDNTGKTGFDDVTITVKPSPGKMATTALADAAETTQSEVFEEAPFEFMDKQYPGGHRYAVRIYDDSGQLLFSGEWSPERYSEIFNKDALYLYNVFKDGLKIDDGKVRIVK